MMFKVVVAISCFIAVLAYPNPVFDSDLDSHWELFKQTYNKLYKTHEEETLKRLIWEEHVNYIAKHNREYDMGIHDYSLGINEYADMSNKEFVSIMTGYKRMNKTRSGQMFLPSSLITIPESIDWRDKGYVTSVKTQLQCGSCWAFSTTGSVEGQHFKATGKLISLSAQNLIDCSTAEGNHGCEGGLMDYSYKYIIQNGGIDTEASYPYTGQDGKCHYEADKNGATVKGYFDIKSGDEDALQQATATIGPIAVAMDANHPSFQLYKSGIYNEKRCSSVHVDHTALVVGYSSTSSGQEYWIVKNSWGTSWGNKGYILMSRNKNNQCGIATEASYPTV